MSNVIEILPKLWVSDMTAAKDRNFFVNNNIRYVINLTYDIPNYFSNVTYFNVPIRSDKINESELILSMNQLFDVINKFIVQGYNYGIGILIHDKTGKLALMFASGFIMDKLKITLKDVQEYVMVHNYNQYEYINNNPFLINYGKKLNTKQCG